MASVFDRIYKNTPIWVQNLGISFYGLIWKQRRWGGKFSVFTEEFIQRENFSDDQWEEYQNLQLTNLLTSAWKTPYYQSIFKQKGLTPEITSLFKLIDLQKLPLLDKQSLRLTPELFISNESNRDKLHTYLTSGTTGTPIGIMMTNTTHQAISAAYEARCRHWAGINFKMSRAMIGGRLVVPQANSQPPFWRYNQAEKQLYLSAFHISPKNTIDYVMALNRYKPNYLVGYAKSHFLLACMIQDQGLKVHRPFAILTSSEKLTLEMREKLQEVYQCEVFDGYSAVENCCLASECEHHRLHISPDVGIIEIVDERGNVVGLDHPGLIVATGFLNHDQPLIRYQTGDYAILSSEICPCGRNMPILKEIIGRLEDVVIGVDGRQLVRFHGIFVGIPHVREGQVIQETYTKFTLKLVVDPEFNNVDRKILSQRFFERLGDIELNFEIVDQIPRTERGKFRAVISNIKKV